MAAFAKSCPESLKPLVLGYLQRAGEFAVRNPTVAYYCKKYAVELAAANRPADDPTVMPWLLSLMDELEATRAGVTQDSDEARDTVNTVALTLFAKADAQERTNNVDKTTVQIFRVASVLMTVTEQFGELDSDIAEKRKYARWKAAAIKRCLDQGVPYQREPDTQEDLDDLDELSGGAPAGGAAPPPVDTSYQQPGYGQPYPSQAPSQPPAADPWQQYGYQPAPAAPQQPTSTQMPWDAPASQPQHQPQWNQPAAPPVQPAPVVTPVSAPADLTRGGGAGGYDPYASTVPSSSYTSTPQPTPVAPPAASPYSAPTPVHQPAATYHAPSNANFEPSFDSQQEAIKCAKYIISALQFNDFTTARTNARKALELLEGHTVAARR